MSVPLSVQEMVYKSGQLGGQGSTQHPLFNVWFYGSKGLVTPFWLGQNKAKIKMCYAFRPLFHN